MNTLITILVFALVLLTAVIIAFLAGLHAAKLGIQEIVRDNIAKSKKEEDEPRYDYDSDYDEDEDEYDSDSDGAETGVSYSSSIQPYYRPPPQQRQIIEEHYSLTHDNYVPPPSTRQNTSITNRPRHTLYIGDDKYLPRIQ